jgi:uncharacterized phiE125 gp8 family phage protein
VTPPVLVTAPTTPVVALADLKAHLRVDHLDDDSVITSLEAAAVAHLDGWTGILGRAIRPQVWRQDFTAGEPVRLAMPDVTSITVAALDAAGGSVSVTATLRSDQRGPWVEIVGAYDRVQVTYTCAMTAAQLPAAQIAVKLLVAHWYANRETAVTGTITAQLPFAVDALVKAMRWMDF